MLTPEHFNQFGSPFLPGFLGIVITEVSQGLLKAELPIQPHHLAPNGYLHAGTVVSLADTAAGYGCVAHFSEGATGFTTIELKTNFLGTARQGVIECTAQAVHLGKTTQVWDATVTSRESGKTMALFRCTQLLIYR